MYYSDNCIILIRIQFYSRPEFDLVVQAMEREEQKATVLAIKKYIEYKERKEKELDLLQQQKTRRKQQLETCKSRDFYFFKYYLITTPLKSETM
mgnify:CR=1 FL=1